MSWDNYSNKTVTIAAGGDYPEVPDDLYDAMVQDVSDPETRPDPFNEGKEKTDFFVTWEITSGDVKPGTTLRQYVTLPEQFMAEGFLNEKSNLYKLMEALGFDLTGKFKVAPPTWQGMEARVMVENRANKMGESRPRITAVKPARKAKPAGSAKRSTDWKEDDD